VLPGSPPAPRQPWTPHLSIAGGFISTATPCAAQKRPDRLRPHSESAGSRLARSHASAQAVSRRPDRPVPAAAPRRPSRAAEERRSPWLAARAPEPTGASRGPAAAALCTPGPRVPAACAHGIGADHGQAVPCIWAAGPAPAKVAAARAARQPGRARAARRPPASPRPHSHCACLPPPLTTVRPRRPSRTSTLTTMPVRLPGCRVHQPRVREPDRRSELSQRLHRAHPRSR